MIIYLQQPEKSSLCGQTCVAMIAGVTLEKSLEVFGTKGGTKPKQLIDTLKVLGVNCGDSLVKIIRVISKPPICIVRLHFKESKHTHWTIWYKDHYLDPALPMYVVEYPIEVAWETSFIAINQDI
jgi:hypothetical protein